MKQAVCQIESIMGSPYSQSRYHALPKLPKEGPDDYERRTWREKAHYDADGMAYVPAMSLKNAVAEAASMMSLRIPGRGTATYTKHFLAGVQCFDNVPLNVHRDKVQGVWLHVNADGKRGGGKRVMRCFPVFERWAGTVTFLVVDSQITQEVFEQVLSQAGGLVGIGRFRPAKGGINGRFSVKKIKWSDA